MSKSGIQESGFRFLGSWFPYRQKTRVRKIFLIIYVRRT